MPDSVNSKSDNMPTSPRVGLVIPSQAHVYGVIRPPSQLHLGIAYIAAAIGDLCRVKIIDMDGQKLTAKTFAENLRNSPCDIVGFTVATPTFHQAVALAKIIREISPTTWVVFGGYHPTLMPEEVLSEECVDIAVIGEGEESFRQIVEAKEQGRTFQGIPGTMVRDTDGILHRTPQFPFDRDRLNRLPFPARHLFATDYSYPDALYPRVAPIITSRGCPGRCSFCNAHNMYAKLSFRSAENIVDEIEDLICRQGFQEIHIWDDNFTTSQSRVLAIRDELQHRQLKVPIALPGGIRADSVTRATMSALRDMGVYSLAIGVESGVQEILDRANKGVTLDQIRQAFTWAREFRIETWAFFLFGLLGETPETLRRSIDFAISLNPDVAKFHILKPYPGSRIYEQLKENDWLVAEDYAALGIHLPPVHRLPGLRSEDLVLWQKRAYRQFYLSSPQRIWRQLRRIRSWHRFKVNLSGGISLFKLLFKTDR